MPAYSFQGQFVPYIEDESKDHTVRAERNSRAPHAKPGDKVYLYFGMRTKLCRKIGEAICFGVQKIIISEEGIYLGGEIGTMGWSCPKESLMVQQFAWKDGFRPEGSTFGNPVGAFDLMLQFWKQNHELPFTGVVIYWKNFKATPK